MHIAVLEDDPLQSEHLCVWLSSAGHTSDIFATGLEFKTGIVKKDYDLCMIDWGLPDINGDEILVWLRNELHSDVPVIFVTGRGQEEDIARVLQLGADDYMVKPISPVEMLARITAIARRSGIGKENPKVISMNNISIDLERRSVMVNKVLCDLTPKEFDLAAHLLQNLGLIMSRDQLLETVWKITGQIDSRTVDTHISRLRKKLGLEPSKGWNLSVVYQYGYRLDKIEPTPPNLVNES